MCQVIPFTLPCCRRVYVSVSRLPSCPASWPKSKCPPELCIQVRGVEPEERSTGECWRCKAEAAGKSGFDKDMLRPGIDKAYIVLGLEELGIVGRRRVVEEGGHCWFCNARGGCGECGAREIKAMEEQTGSIYREETPSKRRHQQPRTEKDRGSKRVKAERSEGQSSTPNSMYSSPSAPISILGYSPHTPLTPAGSYPDPSTSSNWSPHKYPNSPYGLGSRPKFGTSSSFQGYPPRIHSPLSQQVTFNSPTPGSWNAINTSQSWPGMSYMESAGQQLNGNVPYSGFVGQQPSGNMSYNNSPRVVKEQPSGNTQASFVDPSLLYAHTKPDPEPIPDLNTYPSWPWNDDMKVLVSISKHKPL